MTISAFDSLIYRDQFSHAGILEIYADDQQIRTLLEVEAALADAQERLQIVPIGTAAAIRRAMDSFQPQFGEIAAQTAVTGVPVIDLLRQFKIVLDGEFADYIHWGATSQDIIDCSQLLLARSSLEIIETELNALVVTLAGLADRHRQTLMVGRTRSQQAAPISFGLKAANWLAPLVRHQRRLAELRSRFLVVQLGGATGTGAALKGRGVEVMETFAAVLDLGTPASPWHNQRDNIAELAGWLSLVSGSVGKIGQDLVLMAQTEIGEISISGGASSTMPHKRNPIAAEMLCSLAAINANLVSAFHHGIATDHERPTVSWQLEWMNIPQMLNATAAALSTCTRLLDSVEINPEQMQENLARSNGLVLAEAATFLLADILPRSEAITIVEQACERSRDSGEHLVAILRDTVAEPVDWYLLDDSRHLLGSADDFIDRILAEANN